MPRPSHSDKPAPARNPRSSPGRTPGDARLQPAQAPAGPVVGAGHLFTRPSTTWRSNRPETNEFPRVPSARAVDDAVDDPRVQLPEPRARRIVPDDHGGVVDLVHVVLVGERAVEPGNRLGEARRPRPGLGPEVEPPGEQDARPPPRRPRARSAATPPRAPGVLPSTSTPGATGCRKCSNQLRSTVERHRLADPHQPDQHAPHRQDRAAATPSGRGLVQVVRLLVRPRNSPWNVMYTARNM